MKKNSFLSAVIILIFSGMSTKVLGLLIKIIYTRIVPPETIGIYSIIMPTYSLFLNIATLAMPATIAKLLIDDNNKELLQTAAVIIITLNLLLVAIMHLISPFIATNLLNNPECKTLLNAASLSLPLASIACIFKGYFYGKQKMLPHAISNTLEQIVRLLLIIFFLPIYAKKSYLDAAKFLILTSVVTETVSIITFLILMPRDDKIILTKIKYNPDTSRNIFSHCFPLVSSHIVSNIGYFFEPIILTKTLLHKNISNQFIIREYGIYNAYTISTLLIPSFFINAIALALLPELTKLVGTKLFKKRYKQAFFYTIILSIIFSLIMFLFPEKILFLLYKKTVGASYIKILAPFFVLFYLEGIYNVIFQALGKVKISFKITVISSISKLISLFIFSILLKGIYGLIISEISNIIFIIILDHLYLKKQNI